MKLFITDNFHHKNQYSLEKGLKEIGVIVVNNIIDADIIYSPNDPINISLYPNKKFIFGPHFSVIPNNKTEFNDKYKNAVYIQPSEWVKNLWVNEFKYDSLPVKIYSFGVNTDLFKPIDMNKKDIVFIYFKRRDPIELNYVINYVKSLGILPIIFDYVKKYDEKYYLQILQKAKYGIWIGSHESQGFALQEALSCNVPLLIWNVTKLSQEFGSSNYNNINTIVTTIPYWNDMCGEYFYNKEEFIDTYKLFINKINEYQPRKFILDNLTIKDRALKFLELIQ